MVRVRRIYDVGGLSHTVFQSIYKAELDKLKSTNRITDCVNFNRTGVMHACERFGHATVADTIGGETTFKEASRLLGIKKLAAFDKYVEYAGQLR